MSPMGKVAASPHALPAIGIPSPEADHRAIAELDPSEIELFMEEVRFSAPALFGGGERRHGNLAVIAAGPNDPATALRVLQMLAPDRARDESRSQDVLPEQDAAPDCTPNIESAAYTLIQHSFAMILILQVDDAEVAGLTELLESQLESEIAVQVVDLEHQPRVLKGGKLMSLWASVRETPGSLALLSRALERCSANIERSASWVSEVEGIATRRCIINSEFTVPEDVTPTDVSSALGVVFPSGEASLADGSAPGAPLDGAGAEVFAEYAVSLGRSEVPDGYRLRRGNDGTHILTFFGMDRPGLMADCAEALGGRGINIECSSQVVLQGYSAFVALIESSNSFESDELSMFVQKRLDSASPGSVQVRVFENPAAATRHEGEDLPRDDVLNVFIATPDRPGVVNDLVATVLKSGSTVTRFAGMVTCPDNPLFSLRMEILGASDVAGALELRLANLIGSEGSLEVVPGFLHEDSPVGAMPLPAA